jgi:hypothetical protein
MPEQPSSSNRSPEQPGMVVTHLQSTQQQVGGHVIEALQQQGTVAVLTTVVPGADGQSIVSVGLDEATLERVRELLANTNVEELPRVPCLGFHCFVNHRGNGNDEDNEAESTQHDFP